MPSEGVEGKISWDPMPENTNFKQFSLGEGFAIKLKSMEISIIRKLVVVHSCLPYLKSIHIYFSPIILSRKVKASGFNMSYRVHTWGSVDKEHMVASILLKSYIRI
jgi:hypothetical protein